MATATAATATEQKVAGPTLRRRTRDPNDLSLVHGVPSAVSHDGEKNAVEIPFWHLSQQFVYAMADAHSVRWTQVVDPVIHGGFKLRGIPSVWEKRNQMR